MLEVHVGASTTSSPGLAHTGAVHVMVGVSGHCGGGPPVWERSREAQEDMVNMRDGPGRKESSLQGVPSLKF